MVVFMFHRQLLIDYAAKMHRFGVQRQQTLLATTEFVVWGYANAFIFTNQSELDFGIAYVLHIPSVCL
jgi:hypothetical protein